MTRKCFYSFHYEPDNWRASTVRNIGSIEGNKPVSDNDWEQVVGSGDEKIKRWISNQMVGRSCAIILVGEKTAKRKWINHEIVHAWDNKLGVVGIRIHGLKDRNGQISAVGANPFDYINFGSTGKKLSEIVKCYNPAGSDSTDKYAWITEHLGNAVEEAINIRNKY